MLNLLSLLSSQVLILVITLFSCFISSGNDPVLPIAKIVSDFEIGDSYVTAEVTRTSFSSQIATESSESPPDVVIFLGRFHPLVIHLPISFILLALFIEIASKFKRFAYLKPASSFILFLGALSAIIAVIAGYLLSLSGEYGDELLGWHKWLGIAVAITAVIAYSIKKKSESNNSSVILKRSYAAMLGISGALLIVASHFGGSLTHGSDYLTSYMPEPIRSWAGIPPRENDDKPILLTNIDEAHVYTDIISPILESKCTSCHNDNKKKGDLILTTQQQILNGGENGPIFERGNAENSEIYRRLTLDRDDDDHMPPSGRKPLSDDYINLIRWWIEEGAPFNNKVSELVVTEEVQGIFDRMSSAAEEARLALNVAPADPDAIQAVSDLGVLILPLSQETNLLQAQFLNVADDFSDDHMDLLLPLSDQITWLDLGGTSITDAGMPVIAELKNLTKLHLEKTKITDKGLVHLKNLQNLEYLNLYGTVVTDAGLDHLTSLSNLRSLYLWQSNVTKEGVDSLREGLPELDINVGWQEASVSD